MEGEARTYNLIVVLGPTASGKTALAVRLSRYLSSDHGVNCEIISADSRQVYRGMDLGTGKDLNAFVEGGDPVPYHLIDIVDPHYEFNLFEFRRTFDVAFSEIQRKGACPVMVGGTGLYIESVVEGYELPAALGEESVGRISELMVLEMDELRRMFLELKSEPPHNKTDLEDKRRLVRAVVIEEKRLMQKRREREEGRRITPIIAGVRIERSILRDRIRRRLFERIDRGMIEEVEALRERGVSWGRLDSLGLEYRYISRFLRGEINRDEMVQTLAVKIGQFAKRQETWFRRMERKGVLIHWIDGGDFEALRKLVERKMIRIPHVNP